MYKDYSLFQIGTISVFITGLLFMAVFSGVLFFSRTQCIFYIKIERFGTLTEWLPLHIRPSSHTLCLTAYNTLP
jgi:hypothetical protein